MEWRRFDDMTTRRVYQALRFRQAIFVVEQASPYPDLDGLDTDAWHLLVHRDDVLLGYLRLLAPPPAARIGRVCVAAGVRGQGLGRRLMLEALSFAGCYGGADVALSAQTALAAFYETLGFAVVSPPYDDHGVGHVDMIRRRK